MRTWLKAFAGQFSREPADLAHVAVVTGSLFMSGVVLLTVSLLLPHPAQGEAIIWGIIISGGLYGLSLLYGASRTPLWVVHGGVGFGAFLISLAIFASGEAGSPYSVMYFWVVLVAAYFFTVRVAVLHSAWMLGLLAATLVALDADSGYADLTRWLVWAFALTITGAMISLLVARRQRAELRTKRFFDLALDMLCTVDRDGYFTELNSAWEQTLGFSAEELMSKPALEFVHPDDRERTELEISRQFRGKGSPGFENRYCTADGDWRWLLWSGTVSEDEGLVYARATDVTDRKKLEQERQALHEKIEEQARTDALTGLPNRRWLQDELRTGIARAVRRGSPFWAAIIDLDHFKLFNDELGHLEGDAVLRESAESWRAALRAEDFIARFGGEEFVVLMADAEQGEVEVAVERLRQATPRGQTCSAGVARWEPGENSDLLIRRADEALYEAKNAGRNRAVFAAPKVPDSVWQDLLSETEAGAEAESESES